MKKQLIHSLALIVILSFLVQPVPTLANSDQVKIPDSSFTSVTQTPTPHFPYDESEDQNLEKEIEAERQRILEEHLREEGVPEELLSHENGSNPQEKKEYVPPSNEVIAQTKAQVNSFSCADVADVPVSECEALVALYESTNGAGWFSHSNWLVTNTVSNWDGVTVESGHVVELSLGWNNLNGTIPTELGYLLELEFLSLSENVLRGNIPSELGNLYNLRYLILYDNYLSSSIPSMVGDMFNLEFINLSNNRISGCIPPELGSLFSLWYIDLHSNQLNGSIPAELGNLFILNYLYLNNNQLNGSIPPELGNLSNLDYLYLNNNQLNGSIPPELGNLSNLEYLYLSNNQLSGSIPPELSDLSDLEYLYLSNNQLSGSIPPELSDLSDLGYLDLSNNQLSGSIPQELVHLVSLNYLYLNDNQLSGSIPPLLGYSHLHYLDLQDNQLSGSIPPLLGNLFNLDYLNLSNNQLSGSIPSELGNLFYLGYLDFSNNQLSGSIPSELGNLSYLEYLYLSNNQLSGSIPLSFINLTSLDYFYFYDTLLCEPNAPEFLAWKETVYYWVGSGKICGTNDISWLLMYYLDGDNDLNYTYNLIFNYLEKGTGTQNIKIVVLWDKLNDQNSNYYIIKHDENLSSLANYEEGIDKWSKGELNMGDPQTLSDFISWSIEKFPSEHYALILDDHGHGLGGSMVDSQSNSDKLTLTETKSALSTVFSSSNKLDVLVMNACLMGLIENGYQFKDLVYYYVASEAIQHVFYQGYEMTLNNINYLTTPLNVAEAFVNGYADNMELGNRDYTMSVANLSFANNMKISIDTLSNSLDSDIAVIDTELWNIRNLLVQKFEGYVDLEHLAELIYIDDLFSENIRDSADEVISTVHQYIVYERSSLENAHGVSIFFPDIRSSYYNGNNNDFAAGTVWNVEPGNEHTNFLNSESVGWGNMLVHLFDEIDPGGPDNPNEPEPLPKVVDFEIYLPTIIR